MRERESCQVIIIIGNPQINQVGEALKGRDCLNMGRKDASGQHSQPLDQYRKQIGKQDWKKSKKDVKIMKQKADESTEFTPKIVVLMIGVIIVVLSSLYMLLVWYLGVDSVENIKDKISV